MLNQHVAFNYHASMMAYNGEFDAAEAHHVEGLAEARIDAAAGRYTAETMEMGIVDIVAALYKGSDAFDRLVAMTLDASTRAQGVRLLKALRRRAAGRLPEHLQELLETAQADAHAEYFSNQDIARAAAVKVREDRERQMRLSRGRSPRKTTR